MGYSFHAFFPFRNLFPVVVRRLQSIRNVQMCGSQLNFQPKIFYWIDWKMWICHRIAHRRRSFGAFKMLVVILPNWMNVYRRQRTLMMNCANVMKSMNCMRKAAWPCGLKVHMLATNHGNCQPHASLYSHPFDLHSSAPMHFSKHPIRIREMKNNGKPFWNSIAKCEKTQLNSGFV